MPKIPSLESIQPSTVVCTEGVSGMKRLPAGSIDLVVTSPPYDNLRTYNGYEFDYQSMLRGIYRVLKKGGVCVWIVADGTVNGSETGTSFRQALYALEIGFRLHDTMIYYKDAFHFPQGAVRYWQCVEYMFVFSRGKPSTINIIRDRPNRYRGAVRNSTGRNRQGEMVSAINGGRVVANSDFGMRTNVWHYPTGNQKTAPDRLVHEHPAAFPLDLAKDHIISWSNEGDVVLDPMCGSGQTLIAALLTGRRYIGFDISEEYCALARKRLILYKKQSLQNAQDS